MKAKFEARLLRKIERQRLIAPGDRIAVAVSGGADSVALLRLLERARLRLGITIAVAHFDHGLRQESRADAQFVEELARSSGLPFVSERADVAQQAARQKRNVEDMARRLRYGFFARVLEQNLATRIAVAHTMDDQAETVLARILRGCGTAGITGIYPRTKIVIRPLLGVRRADLRTYLLELGQEWREDPTNQDATKERARIRGKLVPLLERDFSPRAVEHLAKVAEFSHEESRFWAALVEDRFRALATRQANSVSIPATKLLVPLQLAPAAGPIDARAQRSLTERLVRRLYQSVRGDLLELTSAHVEQAISLAAGSGGAKWLTLPGGVTVERNFGQLAFSRKPGAAGSRAGTQIQQSVPAYHYSLQLKGSEPVDVSVPELGACFRLKVIDWPPPERETSPWSGVLDLKKLRCPLVLRNWRAGDGYRPRGRAKTRKLKEMFLAARIARKERSGWPVLESDGQIAWAKGMEPAAEFCAREETRAALSIEERKL